MVHSTKAIAVRSEVAGEALADDELAAMKALLLRQWRSYGYENAIDGLRLTCAQEASGTMRAVYETSFCVVLQGSKVSTLGETPFHYRAGQCLFASVHVPVNSRIVEASPDQPYLAFSLSVQPELVTELLLEHGNQLKGTGQPALTTGPIPTALFDPLCRLLQLLDNPEDQSVLEPLIRREICWRLLRSPLGPALQQIGMKDSETARIGRATAWLKNHYQESMKVADLASMVNMSPASFHRHFKAITQLTPIQFQKQIRLQEARRLLLTDHEVASVGYQVGYESASQFSRDYRKMFGAPPGQDRAVMRTSVVIESHQTAV
jgi:AraC-like DNA-binding protein